MAEQTQEMHAAHDGDLPAGRPLVEVVRSGFVESIHRGSVIALHPDGTPAVDIGATRVPVFPRSSNKPLQALAMLHAGLKVDDADLALVAGSHTGEDVHVERVRRLLAGAGLTEASLACPADLPADRDARAAAIRAGVTPSRVFMNCSGKHTGMLLACVAAGWPTDGYVDPEHPLQQLIRSTIEDLSEEKVAAVGVDGCGAPVMALSLAGLAGAFSRLVSAAPGTTERRVADAMRANPRLVAGTGREDTVAMDAVPGLLMKGGAEGVHAAALASGAAAAVKIDDGAVRARMPVLTGALVRLGADPQALSDLASSRVRGGGRAVGEVRLLPGAFRRG